MSTSRSALQAESTGLVVRERIHFRTGPRGRKRLRSGTKPVPPKVQPGRVPRVARLLALAVHFDELIRRGLVRDYADLARLGGVSRARISQLMDLLNLAPDIQELILLGPEVPNGQDSLTERGLRAATRLVDWVEQRQALPCPIATSCSQ